MVALSIIAAALAVIDRLRTKSRHEKFFTAARMKDAKEALVVAFLKPFTTANITVIYKKWLTGQASFWSAPGTSFVVDIKCLDGE